MFRAFYPCECFFYIFPQASSLKLLNTKYVYIYKDETISVYSNIKYNVYDVFFLQFSVRSSCNKAPNLFRVIEVPISSRI